MGIDLLSSILGALHLGCLPKSYSTEYCTISYSLSQGQAAISKFVVFGRSTDLHQVTDFQLRLW